MTHSDHPLDPSPGNQETIFPGQRIVVAHPPQIAKAIRQALLKPFCPTDIGIFRSILHHERQRPNGAAQTIFIHCVQGEGWCEMSGIRHAIHENQLLVIPAHCPHAYGASNDAPWTIEWFHVIGTGIPEHLKQLGVTRRSPILNLQPGVWDSAFFEEALVSLEDGFTDLHLRHSALTLNHLLSQVIIRRKEIISDRTSIPARLEKVIAHLQKNYANPLSVPDLASLAGFSVSHFTSLFLEHTGHPPADYLIRTRIGHACQLLDVTTLSIKEIAEMVGYSDPYYFSRLFRKSTGYSPRVYRNIHKG